MASKEEIKAVARAYWESCLKKRKADLAELLEDQLETLEEESPRPDLAKAIMKANTEVEQTEIVIKQIKKL